MTLMKVELCLNRRSVKVHYDFTVQNIYYTLNLFKFSNFVENVIVLLFFFETGVSVTEESVVVGGQVHPSRKACH